MAADSDPSEFGELSPDEAFAVLGDETRLQILRVLGETEGPLPFSELYSRTDYDRTPNFNYHLTKLRDHFVEKTDEGYVLRQAGRRVVEAILSGAVTYSPVVERTPVETACFLCGGQMEVSYREERLAIYCTDCGGTRNESSDTVDGPTEAAGDIIGGVGLPPAGVHDRTPTELLRAAEIWTVAHGQATVRGVCPRCSVPIDRTVHVCEDHDATDGRCAACSQRFAITTAVSCTNCIFRGESVFTSYLLGTTEVMGFLIDHGIDPIRPEAFHLSEYEETVLSVEPFEARFTLTADNETLTLAIDDDLSVVDAERREASESIRE
jgi:DNA-binding transcriptional ArsR family regulator